MARVQYQAIPMPPTEWSARWGQRLVSELRSIFSDAVKLDVYTVAGLPSASALGAGALVFVSNEAGGATVAFSDGTNWRRVQDRAVVS